MKGRRGHAGQVVRVGCARIAARLEVQRDGSLNRHWQVCDVVGPAAQAVPGDVADARGAVDGQAIQLAGQRARHLDRRDPAGHAGGVDHARDRDGLVIGLAEQSVSAAGGQGVVGRVARRCGIQTPRVEVCHLDAAGADRHQTLVPAGVLDGRI